MTPDEVERLLDGRWASRAGGKVYSCQGWYEARWDDGEPIGTMRGEVFFEFGEDGLLSFEEHRLSCRGLCRGVEAGVSDEDGGSDGESRRYEDIGGQSCHDESTLRRLAGRYHLPMRAERKGRYEQMRLF